MVLEWVKQGNKAGYHYNLGMYFKAYPGIPDHPRLSAEEALRHCVKDFPYGMLDNQDEVGDGKGQLLPGLYEFRTYPREGSLPRVPHNSCHLYLNMHDDNRYEIDLPTGEPFTFRFFTYHGSVYVDCGYMYRIGD